MILGEMFTINMMYIVELRLLHENGKCMEGMI